MRLYHCHIDHFGGLSDLDLDFRETLHVEEEPNGWGKSTLAAFLQVMFYGFANEKSRTELTNERRRYAPWQQGVYGGTVTFSHAGRLYRLERVFGTRNGKEDTTAVYDAETNLPVRGMPDNPGELLFSIDRESFGRTVYIAQQDCATEATAGIQARISRLENETADMTAYPAVMEKLKKTADSLTPHRKTGEISRLRQEKAALEADTSGRSMREKTLSLLEEQQKESEAVLARHRKDMEEAQEELRHLAVIQQTAEDFTLKESELLRLQVLDAQFPAGGPSEEEMDEAEACLQELRQLRSAYEQTQRTLYDPEAVQNGPQEDRHGTSLISVLVFALFASALLAFFLNRYIALALLALAVIIMVMVVRKDMQKEKKEEKKQPEIVLRQKVSPLEKVTDLRAARQKLREQYSAIRTAETELLEFLRQYYPELAEGEDLSRKLQQLQYEKAEYHVLLEKEEQARRARQQWEAQLQEVRETFGEQEEEEMPFSAKELEERIAGDREEIAHRETMLQTIRRQIEDTADALDVIAEEEERLALLRETLQKMQHRYEVITRTEQYLACAREAFTARYMEPIRRAFDRYYGMLSGNDDRPWQLDADLKITLREYGAFRDPAYLSEGWQDLIGLCRRMAMIDVMYGEEKPFLLFDDPFVNLDEEKLTQALQFLQQISARYQVLYFTCHPSRVPSELL